jgi:hypothetical protein
MMCCAASDFDCLGVFFSLSQPPVLLQVQLLPTIVPKKAPLVELLAEAQAAVE